MISISSVRKKIILTAIVIAVAIISTTAWYFYRWHNYSYRPLFFNTYSTNRDGLGPWRWRFEPIPLLDTEGRGVFFDFHHNMIAVVKLQKSNGMAGIVCLKATDKEFVISIDGIGVSIPVVENSLILINGLPPTFVRSLESNKADSVFKSIEVLDPDHRVLAIDELLKKG